MKNGKIKCRAGFLALVMLCSLLSPGIISSAALQSAPDKSTSSLWFAASASLPLPQNYMEISRRYSFSIGGTVYSLSPLLSVSVEILDDSEKSVSLTEKTFSEEDCITSYALWDETFQDTECLSGLIPFKSLSVGKYKLILRAESSARAGSVLAEGTFTITKAASLQLYPNNLRGSYETALAFFGSDERFLFPYRFTGNTTIAIDSQWLKTYTATANGYNGKKWTVHVDAVPYFEQACRYMENTYVRVHGTNGDTGAVLLGSLFTNDGTMISRFTRGNAYISHHSFGTVIDVNAHTAANSNKLKNRELIYQDVTENLVYNGLIEYQNQLCYDFTYSGTNRTVIKRVPDTVINYILYELAFYRAGFAWGVYYPHTSDAMHFSLTELSPALFEDGPYAMRKVYAYSDSAE